MDSHNRNMDVTVAQLSAIASLAVNVTAINSTLRIKFDRPLNSAL
jgi:hypothetical protein